MKMRIYINLILLLLCLSGTLYAQSPVLETKVSMQYREMEIGKILKDLNKRYKLNFSYSNNIVPEKKKVSISIKNVMLKDALKDLFKETDVAFQVVGEQIVLKKGIKKTSSRLEKYRVVNVVSVPPVLYDPAVSHDDLVASNSEDFIIDTMPDDELGMEMPLLIEDNYQPPSRKDLRRKYRGERKLLKARFYILKDSLRRKGGSTMVNLEMKYNYIAQKMRQEFNQLRNPGPKDTAAPVVAPTDTSKKTPPVVLEEKKDYLYRPFQITFISPLGTNGHDCGKTVNSFSFNMIGGYAAGLEGLELGGVANVEKDYMRGIQMAGVANVVKNKAEGIQLSGFANVCGDTTKALQAAGFCNVVNGSFHGMQNAGFCNVDRGSVKGFQGAGFINVMQDSLNGIQIAGFANLNNGNVTGIQAAGFLNTAKKVKGVQFGVINIADTIQGVPVGLLSIVKKGGYRRVDLFATEALYANVAFKIGVRQLYNIFTGGVQFKDNKMRLAAGCGIGTEAKIGNRGFANLETVTMYVWEQDMVAPKLNMLNKLSSTVGVRLGKTTSIYAGPSLNVMLSQYQDPDKSTLGSDLAPYSIYNHTFNSNSSPKNDVNLKIWLGVTAGVRF